jgi:hypothetical protein
MNLDLDQEYISLTSDTTKDCYLCTHNNHNFLAALRNQMLLKCDKRNLYDLLYKTYQARMRPLKNQNMDVLPITRAMIQEHFERHAMTYNNGVLDDVRVIQQLMNVLEGRLKLKDGSLDTTNISLFKQLSGYKIQLLKKLSIHEHTDKVVDKPHEFI